MLVYSTLSPIAIQRSETLYFCDFLWFVRSRKFEITFFWIILLYCSNVRANDEWHELLSKKRMIASHENSGIERVCAMHVWEEGRTDHQSYFLNFRKVTFQVSINAPSENNTKFWFRLSKQSPRPNPVSNLHYYTVIVTLLPAVNIKLIR